jgi:hypothetical protein
MVATGWLIRRQLRRRWSALVPVALLVACGATATFVAAGAADRTDRAYSRYLERAEVGDVVINPSLFDTDIDRVIRTLPGVRSVTTDAIFVAGIVDGTMPRTWGEVDADPDLTQVRGSTDGRYTTMDRPALAEGRLATGPREVLVSVELADARGLGVGDVVPLAFLSTYDDLVAEPEDAVVPIAVEQVTVVGVATFADEVLPDGLFERARVIVSPDLAARYDCLPDPPPIEATLTEAAELLAPPGCAATYRYWSLEIEGGARSVAAALEAFVREGARLAETLPPDLGEVAGYHLIATTTAEERARIERSTQPTVTALAVLAAVAGVVTLVALALLVARELRRAEDDLREWWRLGSTRRERVAVLLVPVLVAVAAGIAGALAVSWLLTPVAPIGSVRAVEPSPGRELSSWVGVAAAAMGGIGALGILALAIRAAGRSGRPVQDGRERAMRARFVRRSRRPDVGEGLRAAYGGGRGAGVVVASCGLAAGVFLAAAVFAASLSAMLATPAAYGWPWDVAVLGGAGYGDLDAEAIEAAVGRNAAVRRATSLGLTNDVVIDGEPVFSVVAIDQWSSTDLAVVDGGLPRRRDEVALGSRTAAERGVGVGDRVEVSGAGIEPHPATVTGIAVLPPLGQLQADRAGPGRGAVLPVDMFDPDAVATQLTFVGMHLVDGADAAAVARDLEAAFVSANGVPPIGYADPVRPPEIVDVQSMRAIPLLVGGLLAATAVVALAVALALSVRARRRDLAILRALGFTARQVQTSVRVQTVAVVAAALAFGAPLGIAAGRVTWQAFASRLGIVTDPSIPLSWVAATVVGSFVVALGATALPALAAARIQPAAVLRTE